jgi:hypothetical protein
MTFSTCLCITALLACATAFCADVPPAIDSDLPQPLNEAVAQELLSSSPFTRSLNLSDSYHLTGIAYVGGKPVATFYNSATRESFVVSEEPNAQGWKLVDTSVGADLKRTQVKLAMGSEVITVRYSDEQMNLPAGKKGPPVMSPSEDGEMRHKSHKGDHEKERVLDPNTPLSENSQKKLDEIMKARMEKHPEMTEADKAAYAERVMAKLQSGDQKAAAAAASGAPPPTPKVKGSKSSRSKGM